MTLHKVGPELTDKDQRFETNLELPDKMDSHPMTCLCVLVGSTEPLAAVQFLNKDHVVCTTNKSALMTGLNLCRSCCSGKQMSNLLLRWLWY